MAVPIEDVKPVYERTYQALNYKFSSIAYLRENKGKLDPEGKAVGEMIENYIKVYESPDSEGQSREEREASLSDAMMQLSHAFDVYLQKSGKKPELGKDPDIFGRAFFLLNDVLHDHDELENDAVRRIHHEEELDQGVVDFLLWQDEKSDQIQKLNQEERELEKASLELEEAEQKLMKQKETWAREKKPLQNELITLHDDPRMDKQYLENQKVIVDNCKKQQKTEKDRINLAEKKVKKLLSDAKKKEMTMPGVEMLEQEILQANKELDRETAQYHSLKQNYDYIQQKHQHQAGLKDSIDNLKLRHAQDFLEFTEWVKDWRINQKRGAMGNLTEEKLEKTILTIYKFKDKTVKESYKKFGSAILDSNYEALAYEISALNVSLEQTKQLMDAQQKTINTIRDKRDMLVQYRDLLGEKASAQAGFNRAQSKQKEAENKIHEAEEMRNRQKKLQDQWNKMIKRQESEQAGLTDEIEKQRMKKLSCEEAYDSQRGVFTSQMKHMTEDVEIQNRFLIGKEGELSRAGIEKFRQFAETMAALEQPKGMFHRSNSDEFTAMMESVQKYFYPEGKEGAHNENCLQDKLQSLIEGHCSEEKRRETEEAVCSALKELSAKADSYMSAKRNPKRDSTQGRQRFAFAEQLKEYAECFAEKMTNFGKERSLNREAVDFSRLRIPERKQTAQNAKKQNHTPAVSQTQQKKKQSSGMGMIG